MITEDSGSSFFPAPAEHQEDTIQQLQLSTGSHQHLFYKVSRDGCYYFLKSLRPEYAGQTFYREIIRKEFALGSMLHSDFIVGYHELTDTPAECSLLMDYVNGTTLSDFVGQHPNYFSNPVNLRKFLWQLCSALHELHSHQALHLDLKPSNIMLTSVNHDVRLIDLGCSYMDSRPNLMGKTDVYAAPEQRDGSYDVDARTDIYTIGRILEELSPHQSFFLSIVCRCLKERKEERFQSVSEILLQLEKKEKSLLGKMPVLLVLVALLSVTVFFFLRSHLKDDVKSIADGTMFIDTSCQDTLYLRVLSASDHSVAVVQTPKGGHVYTGDVVIPDSVVFHGETFFIRELDNNAFRECSLVTNIHFPPTLTTIRNSALRNCCSITSLHLPPSLRRLLFEPFSSCTRLKFVSWPPSAVEVPRNCFVACRSLRSISLPEGVKTICQDAFAGCDSLEDVNLPSTLSRIDRGAFYGCQSLRRITLPANVNVLGEYLFYNCVSLEELSVLAPVPPHVSTIVDTTFHGVVRVPSSSFEAYRKAIGWSALNLHPLQP